MSQNLWITFSSLFIFSQVIDTFAGCFVHGLLVFPTHSCYICIIQVQVYHVSLVLLSHGRCSYGKW